MKPTQIVESFVTKGQILEQASKNDAILCRAKYQICSIGEKNRNNRVYEKAVWDKVLADPDITAKLENKSLFFHAEHPTTTQSNTEKVAGVVTDMVLNEGENKVYAIMEVLDTPYGRIVDTLLRAGCGIGVSTRADGELEEALDEAGGSYQRVVPESYRFVTIDFTADPSTFGSELPITVERDVTKVIKTGLDDKKIDRQYATVLLEKLYNPEAVALLEALKSDKQHENCKHKVSEKNCATCTCNGKVNEDADEELAHTLTRFPIGKTAKYKGKIVSRPGESRWVVEGETYNEVFDAVDALLEAIAGIKEEDGDGAFLSADDADDAEEVQDNEQMDETKSVSRETPKKKKKVGEKVKLGDAEMKEVAKLHEKNIAKKTHQFLTDNWQHFIDHQDAVNNIIKVFKIGEDNAEQYVTDMEHINGRISAVTTRSNEKVEEPSGIEKSLEEMSERLVTITAERDKLVESYGKDVTNSTIKIKELKQQLKEQETSAKQKAATLLENITKLNNKLKTLGEETEKLKVAHLSEIKDLKKKNEKEINEIKESIEDYQYEISELKEAHKKDLISFYVNTKVKGMGLRLPGATLTLLESCKTVDEVDALIRRTQNAIRENLVHSADGISEIVMESQSDPNSNLSDMRNKVSTALKHFGV